MNVLIVSEKNITARKIATILSGGKFKTEKVYKYPLYTWENDGKTYRCFGLKGHILKVDFPKQYSNWSKVDLLELVKADTIKIPKEEKMVKLVEKEAKNAQMLIVATDFDREGELIGYDLAKIAKTKNPELLIKRARFSALTKEEIEKAFANLHDPYTNLALAGESRQTIDLVWGATLTRFLSLTAKKIGKNFLSVGRVQSPTLALIVKREEEIRSFVPEKYYQVYVLLEKDGKQFRAHYENQRIKDKKEAETIADEIRKSSAVVIEVSRRQAEQKPPSPFNTTEFLAAASSIAGISPGRAMQIAENLYTRGFISYPRVDNTVYPPSLNLVSIARSLKKYKPVSKYIDEILSQEKITPTRGKKQSTDHPPIYPTGEIPESLDSHEEKIYDLVVRRFLATISESAIHEVTHIELVADKHKLIASGLRYLKEGFLKVYPYSKNKEEILPELNQGEILNVVGVEVVEKETKPPARFSQAGLVREMEKLGLGTKSTRHSIIQTLYERGYVHGNPVQPTELGMAVGRAILKHMSEIATHEMTAELEEKMNAIEEGLEKKENVIQKSREELERLLLNVKPKEEEVRKAIWEGESKDKVIGKCPECGGELQVLTSKKTKKRFLGCSNFTKDENKCSVTFPLPQTGKIISAEKTCESCGTPMVKIINRGKRPWVICPNPKCEKSSLSKKGETNEVEVKGGNS
ncbi:MAG: DNA topoisomerase I [Actinobacteria bacterium]|nr:DNA topoisomerase I [Actinomycetota bacterium]